MSWLGKIKAAQAELATRNVDPWQLPLARVHGKIYYDGLERVSSQTLLDVLEVPQRSQRAGTYRRLSKIMVELGWTPVRVRARTRGDYLEQVRGYARDVRCRSASPNREIAHVGSSAYGLILLTKWYQGKTLSRRRSLLPPFTRAWVRA